MPDPIISIIVCTYNRAELLGNALRTLCDQSLDPSEYELIVVDNNSNDRTSAVVEKFARDHKNIRYVLERKQGVSHARNRGWKEARAEYIAYSDDDCEVPHEWLNVAKEIIEESAPIAFGGPHYAFYKSKKPEWFRDSYESRDFGTEARVLTKNEFLIGCNFFLRRSVLQQLGGFKAELGMNGSKVGYGEETELQKRIRSALGEDAVCCDPRLLVYHLVRPEQMTLPWIARKFVAKGRYKTMVLQNNHHPIGRTSLLLEAARTLTALVFDFGVAVVKRDRTRYEYLQNYFYEHNSKYLIRLGRLLESYKQNHGKANL